MGNWFVIVGLVGALWALQMFLAYRQAQAFMAEVKRLRGSGETAIGVSTFNRMRRRTYAAIAAVDDTVVDAIRLSGLSVWARPRPAPQLVGRSLPALADAAEVHDPLLRAAAMAAGSLLPDTDDDDPDDEPTARGLEEVSAS